MKSNLISLSLLLLTVSSCTYAMHLGLPSEKVGIRALFEFSPETADPMKQLAHTLLFQESTLSRGDRELIAAYVSSLNHCEFCTKSHKAVAIELGIDKKLVEEIVEHKNFTSMQLTSKLSALLAIAHSTQQNSQPVPTELVKQRARYNGATDKEIHHTVAIAAAFCMFNRYVGGLGAWLPAKEKEDEYYQKAAQHIAQHGYWKKETEKQ